METTKKTPQNNKPEAPTAPKWISPKETGKTSTWTSPIETKEQSWVSQLKSAKDGYAIPSNQNIKKHIPVLIPSNVEYKRTNKKILETTTTQKLNDPVKNVLGSSVETTPIKIPLRQNKMETVMSTNGHMTLVKPISSATENTIYTPKVLPAYNIGNEQNVIKATLTDTYTGIHVVNKNNEISDMKNKLVGQARKIIKGIVNKIIKEYKTGKQFEHETVITQEIPVTPVMKNTYKEKISEFSPSSTVIGSHSIHYGQQPDVLPEVKPVTVENDVSNIPTVLSRSGTSLESVLSSHFTSPNEDWIEPQSSIDTQQLEWAAAASESLGSRPSPQLTMLENLDNTIISRPVPEQNEEKATTGITIVKKETVEIPELTVEQQINLKDQDIPKVIEF